MILRRLPIDREVYKLICVLALLPGITQGVMLHNELGFDGK